MFNSEFSELLPKYRSVQELTSAFYSIISIRMPREPSKMFKELSEY